MNYSTEILEQRHARSNRALALFVTLFVHALLLGALFYGKESTSTETKQEVATLGHRDEGEKP
ncbi:MAG: hypothetical protein HUU01_10710 [Saprospiraceae bacterium]|nr:hypothetical protein [Saprospiraceae bacterium]